MSEEREDPPASRTGPTSGWPGHRGGGRRCPVPGRQRLVPARLRIGPTRIRLAGAAFALATAALGAAVSIEAQFAVLLGGIVGMLVAEH